MNVLARVLIGEHLVFPEPALAGEAPDAPADVDVFALPTVRDHIHHYSDVTQDAVGFLFMSDAEWDAATRDMDEITEERFDELLGSSALAEPTSYIEAVPFEGGWLLLPSDATEEKSVMFFHVEPSDRGLVLNALSLDLPSYTMLGDLPGLIERALLDPIRSMRARRNRRCRHKKDLTCDRELCPGECVAYKNALSNRTRTLCTCTW